MSNRKVINGGTEILQKGRTNLKTARPRGDPFGGYHKVAIWVRELVWKMKLLIDIKIHPRNVNFPIHLSEAVRVRVRVRVIGSCRCFAHLRFLVFHIHSVCWRPPRSGIATFNLFTLLTTCASSVQVPWIQHVKQSVNRLGTHRG